MKLPHKLSLALLLAAGLPIPAHAGWFDNEWRNFRTYPRLQKAYTAFQHKDYPTVLKLVGEVEAINPDQPDAAILRAQVCEQTKDYACLQRIGERWRTRFPDDALGYYVLGILGVVTQSDNEIIDQFRLAVERKGVNSGHHIAAATNWVDALLRQERKEEAREVIDWLKYKKIAIPSNQLATWAAQLAPVPNIAPLSQEASATSAARKSAPVKSANRQKAETVKTSSVAAVTVKPAPHFPYAEEAPELRQTMIKDAIYRLALNGNTALLKARVQILRDTKLYSPAIEEALAINLQGSHCDLLLEEIAVNSEPLQTTEATQLAAGYCAEKVSQPELAARYFNAANQLRINTGLTPIPATYNAEANNWFALQRFELALRTWYTSLTLQADTSLAKHAAEVALEHQEIAYSAVMLQKYGQFLAAGQLDYVRAQQAQSNDDLSAAAAFYLASARANPSPTAWHELAYVYAKLGDTTAQAQALQEVLKLDESNSAAHAEYAFVLKHSQPPKNTQALEQFKRAYQLDATRSDYLVEIAGLELKTGNPQSAVNNYRASIDRGSQIQALLKSTDEQAAQQVFDWQRIVQQTEDRWGVEIGGQVRLNKAPSVALDELVGPDQYAQYGSVAAINVQYRLDPLWFTDNPSWIFVRATQGLDDQSLSPTSGNVLNGIGFKQRLMTDHNLIGSVEWFHRNDGVTSDDIMLRLSGSHSHGLDWKPSSDSWLTFNMFGDAAYLVRNKAYYSTLEGQLGQHYKVTIFGSKSTLKPWIGGSASANNDNLSNQSVTRVDAIVGLDLQTWFGGDAWRAPEYRQQLSLELHRKLAGNSMDQNIFLLKWTLFH